MQASLTKDGKVLPAGPEQGLLQTEMGCGDVREKRDASFFSFMRSSPKVTKLANGQLKLTARGRALILERSETARLRNAPKELSDLAGLWTIDYFQDVNGTGWGGANFVGAGGPDYQGRIEFSDKTFTYLRECQRIIVSAKLDDQGQLLKSQDARGAAGPGNCEPLNALEVGLIDLLTAQPLAEQIDSIRLRFTLNNRTLVLSKTNS